MDRRLLAKTTFALVVALGLAAHGSPARASEDDAPAKTAKAAAKAEKKAEKKAEAKAAKESEKADKARQKAEHKAAKAQKRAAQDEE